MRRGPWWLSRWCSDSQSAELSSRYDCRSFESVAEREKGGDAPGPASAPRWCPAPRLTLPAARLCESSAAVLLFPLHRNLLRFNSALPSPSGSSTTPESSLTLSRGVSGRYLPSTGLSPRILDPVCHCIVPADPLARWTKASTPTWTMRRGWGPGPEWCHRQDLLSTFSFSKSRSSRLSSATASSRKLLRPSPVSVRTSRSPR